MQYQRDKKINWSVFGRIIVFIDAANLENSVKDLDWWIDYQIKKYIQREKIKSPRKNTGEVDNN